MGGPFFYAQMALCWFCGCLFDFCQPLYRLGKSIFYGRRQVWLSHNRPPAIQPLTFSLFPVSFILEK